MQEQFVSEEMLVSTPEENTKVEQETPPARFEIITDPKMRQALRDRTEDLIECMVSEHDDVVVFLDKSARPISWLFKELWQSTKPDVPMPEIRFVNIGSNTRVRPSIILELEQQAFDVLVQELSTIYGDQFNGKSMMIVDEVRSSGRSLELADRAFTKAFPKLKQVATQWMFTHADCDAVPWMTIPGATDVLDFSDELLSRSITADSVKKKVGGDLENKGYWPPVGKGRLWNEVNQVVKQERRERSGRTLAKLAKNPVLFDWRERLDGIADRVKTLLAQAPKNAGDYSAARLFATNALALLEDINVMGFETSPLSEQLWDELKQAIDDQDEPRVTALHELRSLLYKLSHNISERRFERVLPLGATESERHYVEHDVIAHAVYRGNADDAVKKLKAQAKQLRAEISAIAKMPRSSKELLESVE